MRKWPVLPGLFVLALFEVKDYRLLQLVIFYYSILSNFQNIWTEGCMLEDNKMYHPFCYQDLRKITNLLANFISLRVFEFLLFLYFFSCVNDTVNSL